MGRRARSGDAANRMSRLKLPGMQLWSAYLALGALALAVHAFLLATGSLEQSWFYDVVGASAVGARSSGSCGTPRIDACRGSSWRSARPRSSPATSCGTGTR